MQFFCYTLGVEPENPPAPSPEAMAEMGRFVDEQMKRGVLIATGGMGRRADAVQVSYDGSRFTTTDGPFAEAKELVGGWALINASSKQEAIEETKKFLRLVGGGEIRVRQVFGPGD